MKTRYHYNLTPSKLRMISRTLLNAYGAKAPLVVISRLSCYIWFILFRSRKTFSLDGRIYQYAIHLANAAFRVERAVEIPVALEMFPWGGNVLEIGNVLSQYTTLPHDIVDKYEKGEGVQNVDIVRYNPGKLYDLIISISTLEHIGWDETPKEPGKILEAVAVMKTLLSDKGKMLVTVPLGYNDFLDRSLNEGSLGFSRVFFLKRISSMNDWEQTTFEEASARKYGERYPCANGIAIGVFEQ